MKLSVDGKKLINVSCDDIKQDGSYEIPEGVTSIGEDAFDGCIGLQTLTIHERVTSIGHYAFKGCIGLKSITIPKGASIGSWAFDGCISLQAITLEGDSSIGNFAFNQCINLQVITLEGVCSIGYYAFCDCVSLHTFTVSKGVDYIGHGAFYRCTSLQSLMIPNRVAYLGDEAFRDCTRLQFIAIPEGGTTIGRRTFSGCSSLQAIIIPEWIRIIGDKAFDGCSSLHSIMIASKNDAAIKRVTGVLPKSLQDKVATRALAEEAARFINDQLSIVAQTPELNPLYRIFNLNTQSVFKSRVKNEAGHRMEVKCSKLPDEIFQYIQSFIINDNLHYQKAQLLMHCEPLPKNNDGMEAYKNKLECIAHEALKKAKDFVVLQKNFEMQLNDIATKEKVLRQNGHIDAAEAAQRLHQKTRTSYKSIFPSNMAQFKKECTKAIDEARPQLEQHRGWKLALSYPALVLTGLGGLIVFADIGHKYVTRKHLFFFQTDTAQKVSALESSVASLSSP